MNQVFATNKYWRNLFILLLLFFSVSFVVIFSKIHHVKYKRQSALKIAIAANDAAATMQGCVQTNDHTAFYFEQGALWAKEMDKETDIVYTSFIDPSFVAYADTTVFYEYPSKIFYTYTDSAFHERKANIPISSFVKCETGRYAILSDYDCQVEIYEKDGTRLFTLSSSLPIADIALSPDGKFLFVTKISLSKSNTFLFESYHTQKGKQLFSESVTFQNIPSCADYKSGWFLWDDTNALYINRRGKVQVLSKTT